MTRLLFARCALAAILSLAAGRAAHAAEPAASLFDFTMKRLDGRSESLAAWRGDVLLIVNTASRCGYTPQYAGLEALYQRYRERGFTVLGFPSNDFGAQEPGSDAEIGTFCRSNYGVDFPMFSKIAVAGEDAHPLYQWLTGQPEPVGGPVRWNFQKYLVDREGRVVARYDSKVVPEDASLTARVEELLAKSPRPAP